ncbi:MAG: hypothetical protein NUV91_08740 [Candidatus Omnitrophica bacterium]|nr:hypothetical protein [Candidatus Omnitrophota bacterium]
MDHWVRVPSPRQRPPNGRTHGVAVSKTGQTIIFHQANPAVLFYSPEGQLLDSWGNFLGAHGLTLVEEQGQKYLWLTDQYSVRSLRPR